MKSNGKWRIGLTALVFGVVFLILFTAVRTTKAENEPIHLVTDWSHRHVVFSPPRDLMDQFRLSQDPRYFQQIIRRNIERQDQGDDWRWRNDRGRKHLLHGDWSIDIGVSSMGVGATVGADSFPAKFSFNPATANCTDFVVYNTSLAGSSTQASVVAFNNLYVGHCTGAPTTYWAFNTGGTALTSVTLSADGSQVAFVQNNSAATHAMLVILKWAANSGTLAAPDTLTAVANSAYPACTAPCMTTLQFSTDASTADSEDATSSPFYDYLHDTIYAGDDNGYLHKFTNVFHGTAAAPPAETISGTVWPCVVSSNYPLSSPVYDQGSGNIFIPSTFGTVKQLSAAVGCPTPTGNIIKTAEVSTPGDPLDGVLLDSTRGQIYLVVSESNTMTTGRTAVYTFPVNFIGGAPGTETILSNDGPGTHIYSGAFDNLWFLGSAGHMYVCGPAAGSNNIPTLYQIPVSPTTGALGTASAGPALATSATGPPLCSPVTEYFNSKNTSGATHPLGTDLIFLSVTSLGNTAAPVSCPANSGCIASFDVTAGATITSSTATAATASEAGGTSGIIVDGSSLTAGASQVYFTTLTSGTCGTSGTGGCAIQASQSALR